MQSYVVTYKSWSFLDTFICVEIPVQNLGIYGYLTQVVSALWFDKAVYNIKVGINIKTVRKGHILDNTVPILTPTNVIQRVENVDALNGEANTNKSRPDEMM